MITIPDSLRKAYSAGAVEPVLMLKIDVPPRVFVTVLDYSQGSGDTLTITVGSDVTTLTEGTDFAATGSNETTASNILTAIRASVDKVRAKLLPGRHDVIQISAGQSVSTLTVSTGDASAWDSILPDAPSQYAFVSGQRPLFGYPCSIVGSTQVAQSIDVVSREVSAEEFEIVFADDGHLRRLVRSYLLYGARVKVYVGAADVDESDFLCVGTYRLREIRPNQDGTIMVELASIVLALADHMISDMWFDMHVLEIMEEILIVCGYSDGDDYDASSFDRTDPAYDSIQHFLTSRFNETHLTGVPERLAGAVDVSALELFNGLCSLLPKSSIGVDSNGLLRHRLISTSVDRVWSAQDDCTLIEQINAWDNVCNQITINFVREGDGYAKQFCMYDVDAAAQFGEQRDVTIDSLWLNASYPLIKGFYSGAQFTPSDSLIHVAAAGRGGYCGSRFTHAGGTSWNREAAVDPATGEHIYLRIDPPGRIESGSYADANGGTIYACDYASVYTAYGYGDPDYWLMHDAPAEQYRPSGIAYHIDSTHNDDGFSSGRAGFETTEPDAWGSQGKVPFVTDVTIPVYACTERLRRFRFGAPVIRVTTDLSQIDVELSDVIQLQGDDQLLLWGVDGTDDATITWEVTRKELKIWDDNPGIEFELTMLSNSDEPASINTSQVGVVITPVKPSDPSKDNWIYKLDGTVVINEALEKVRHL